MLTAMSAAGLSPTHFGASGRALQQFEPQKSAMKLDALGGVKEHANRIRDWETLDRAVEAEIEEQRLFVGWWTANVSVRHGRPENADRRSLISVDIAESETGISQQQVSKWRKWLGNVDDYREKLRGPSWRKAMGGRDETEQRGASGTGDNEWFTPKSRSRPPDVENVQESDGGSKEPPCSSKPIALTNEEAGAMANVSASSIKDAKPSPREAICGRHWWTDAGFGLSCSYPAKAAQRPFTASWRRCLPSF